MLVLRQTNGNALICAAAEPTPSWLSNVNATIIYLLRAISQGIQ